MFYSVPKNFPRRKAGQGSSVGQASGVLEPAGTGLQELKAKFSGTVGAGCCEVSSLTLAAGGVFIQWKWANAIYQVFSTLESQMLNTYQHITAQCLPCEGASSPFPEGCKQRQLPPEKNET